MVFYTYLDTQGAAVTGWYESYMLIDIVLKCFRSECHDEPKFTSVYPKFPDGKLATGTAWNEYANSFQEGNSDSEEENKKKKGKTGSKKGLKKGTKTKTKDAPQARLKFHALGEHQYPILPEKPSSGADTLGATKSLIQRFMGEVYCEFRVGRDNNNNNFFNPIVIELGNRKTPWKWLSNPSDLKNLISPIYLPDKYRFYDPEKMSKFAANRLYDFFYARQSKGEIPLLFKKTEDKLEKTKRLKGNVRT